MADAPLSKSAKKHKKQKKKGTSSTEGGFEVTEDLGTAGSVGSTKPPKTEPVNPITEIKRQIEEAKAAKDHEKTQELRQKLWVLQDTVCLGKTGLGAPEIDLSSVIPSPAKETSIQPQVPSGDPTEKKLHKLRKKLTQIEALKTRQNNGEKLEANQLAKIATESELNEEIDILEDLLKDTQLR